MYLFFKVEGIMLIFYEQMYNKYNLYTLILLCLVVLISCDIGKFGNNLTLHLQTVFYTYKYL